MSRHRNSTWLSVARVAATPVGLLVAALVVAGTSHSAFSASTASGTNSWSTGSLSLTRDGGSTAVFSATGIAPGATGTKCIVVTAPASNGYSGAVRLYATGASATNDLDKHISITVEVGTGGSFDDCTGFAPSSTIVPSTTLFAFAGARTGYDSAVATTHAPVKGVASSRTYRIGYAFSSAATSAQLGAQAQLGFTWELQ